MLSRRDTDEAEQTVEAVARTLYIRQKLDVVSTSLVPVSKPVSVPVSVPLPALLDASVPAMAEHDMGCPDIGCPDAFDHLDLSNIDQGIFGFDESGLQSGLQSGFHSGFLDLVVVWE